MTAASEISLANGPTNPFSGVQAANVQAGFDAYTLISAITSALFQNLDEGRNISYAGISGSDAAGFSFDPTPRSLSLDEVRWLAVGTSAGGQKWVTAMLQDGSSIAMASPVAAEQTKTGASAWFGRIAAQLDQVPHRWLKAFEIVGSDASGWRFSGPYYLLFAAAEKLSVSHSAGGQYWLGAIYDDGTYITVVSPIPAQQAGAGTVAWAASLFAEIDPT